MEICSREILFLVEPFFHGIQYIHAAKEIGCEVIVLRRPDGPSVQDDHHIQEIVVDLFDVDAIIQAIKGKISLNGSTKIGILPGNENSVHIAAEVSNRLGLRGNSYKAALTARNKILMREALKQGNVRSPKSVTFYNMEDIKSQKDFIFPLVVKPPDMSGSMCVQLVNNYEGLIEAANNIFNLKSNFLGYPLIKAVMVEEYVEGNEFSIEIFLENSELKFASVTEKHKGELPYFVELGHVVPSSITTSEQNQLLIDVAFKAAVAVGLEYGPAHVELILDEKGITVIELAARIGGDKIMKLVKLANNIDLPSLAIHQALKHDYKIEKDYSLLRGAAIRFLTASPGRVLNICGVDKVKMDKDVIDVEIYVEIGDYIKPLQSSDERIGDIIVVGKDSKEACEKACKLANLIQVVTSES